MQGRSPLHLPSLPDASNGPANLTALYRKNHSLIYSRCKFFYFIIIFFFWGGGGICPPCQALATAPLMSPFTTVSKSHNRSFVTLYLKSLITRPGRRPVEVSASVHFFYFWLCRGVIRMRHGVPEILRESISAASIPPGHLKKLFKCPALRAIFVGKCPADRSFCGGQMPGPPVHPINIQNY